MVSEGTVTHCYMHVVFDINTWHLKITWSICLPAHGSLLHVRIAWLDPSQLRSFNCPLYKHLRVLRS